MYVCIDESFLFILFYYTSQKDIKEKSNTSQKKRKIQEKENKKERSKKYTSSSSYYAILQTSTSLLINTKSLYYTVYNYLFYYSHCYISYPFLISLNQINHQLKKLNNNDQEKISLYCIVLYHQDIYFIQVIYSIKNTNKCNCIISYLDRQQMYTNLYSMMEIGTIHQHFYHSKPIRTKGPFFGFTWLVI